MDIDVGAEAALADGAMRAIEAGGRKILLARSRGACHAVGAVCPHAGGPLEQGVLTDGVVTCPWHKAAFNVATGRRVEPPAMDDLPRHTLRVEAGRLRLAVSDAPDAVDPVAAIDGADPRCMAIIGTGAAGASAAQGLREAGFAGRVVLIGREDRLPYDRTVLSKYTLSGQQGGEKSPLQDAAFYARHRIERRVAEVVEIDAPSRLLRFADGGSLAYDAAFLATGAAPRRPDVPGAGLPGAFVLRDPEHAASIAAAAGAAGAAGHAVVAGGGFIAMEAAASLRERGLAVTVVAPQATPLQKQLGPEVGGALRRVQESHGIAFRMHDEVAALEGPGRVRRVRLRGGGVLEADLVLFGLGVAPATAALRGVALRPDGGVAVDAHLRAAEALYAGGDIAAFPLRGDGAAVRVEHWRVALQHGRVAAANMAGAIQRYDAVPFFWTILGRQRLDYVGHAERWDGLAIDGDLAAEDFAGRGFLALYLQAGRVAALAGWQRDRQTARALTLLAQRRDWSAPDLLAALGGAD